MSGRWVLDAVALLGASKTVILRHVSVRTRQLEIYKKTSSLAKAIESQASRVTLPSKAATALAKRSKKYEAQYSTATGKSRSTVQISLPSSGSVRGHSRSELNHEILQQDHFYERSEDNSTSQPVPSKALDIQQEEAKGVPLPDGTIPPVEGTDDQPESGADVFYDRSQDGTAKQPFVIEEQSRAPKLETLDDNSILDNGLEIGHPRDGQGQELQRHPGTQIPAELAEPPPSKAPIQHGVLHEEPDLRMSQEKDVDYSRASGSSPAVSSLPHVKLPKVTQATQTSLGHVPESDMNQDVYYSFRSEDDDNTTLGAQAALQEEPVSNEMYSEIFHSPRVAKLLGAKRKGDLGAKSSNHDGPQSFAQRFDGRKTNPVKDVNRDTSTTPNLMDRGSEAEPEREMPETLHSAVPETDNDVQQLAADIAEEAHVDASEAQNVRDSAPFAEL